jgi:hypothetical protein
LKSQGVSKTKDQEKNFEENRSNDPHELLFHAEIKLPLVPQGAHSRDSGNQRRASCVFFKMAAAAEARVKQDVERSLELIERDSLRPIQVSYNT